ncbi:hypothetical protein EDB89DRAFT_1859881 [Lactarius sanguifluus]|nr:hypothetical protein EDB89DRAFT_1859881 [Lactarius sanguifluus]
MVEGVSNYFSQATLFPPLIVSSVLTMYEKSSGKGAKHSWTSSTASIGALSYLAVQCYQHTRQCQFRAMECTVTQTARFTHLPSLAFLCIVPNGIVRRRSTTSHFLELLPGPFEHIFQGLNLEKDLVLAAVKGLLRPSRKTGIMKLARSKTQMTRISHGLTYWLYDYCTCSVDFFYDFSLILAIFLHLLDVGYEVHP